MKNTVMTNDLPRFIHDDKNGLDYTLQGEYYFPELAVPEAEKTPIGKYGLQRLAYLQEHRPGLYTRLILSGKLYAHLAEIDQTCHERLHAMIPRMVKTEGVTEALKAQDQMVWVARMNSIRYRAEETILSELVYE